jgi:ATP-dependent protease HslVU (ClpYQ) ATPase subunit
MKNALTPKAIVAALDEHIIGQLHCATVGAANALVLICVTR